MQKRRTFIKTAVALTAAGIIIPSSLLAMKKQKEIGIQLYTLRDMIKEDFEGTLEIVSDIGYTTVEAAGYKDRKFYGFYPKEYKKILKDYGLKTISSHTKFSLMEAQQVIEDANEADIDYLVFPWLEESERNSIDKYKKLADEFNIIGELCKKSGITFAYHNHAFEFEEINGVVPYNILLENTDPNYVSMELDLYWVVKGGYNPQEYFSRFPGRFKLWHVKDMDKTEDEDFAPVGQGIINFQAIFKQKKLAGMEHIFVEQDSHKNDNPVLNIETSYRYLSNLSEF